MSDSLDLLVTFTRVGLIGWGGGPGMLPVIQAEVVERRHWMTETEFLDLLVVAQALPGPVASKMALSVGLRVAGWSGALISLTGVLAPTGLLMLALASSVQAWKDHPRVLGVLQALRPAVMGMLIALVFSGLRSTETPWMGLAIASVAAIAMIAGKVHPGWVILAAGLFGAVVLGRR